MNENTLKGNWKDLKGSVQEKWGELTDDDMDRIEGKADQLAGAIQKRYGRSQEEAKKEVNDWLDNS
ncbi:MAG: CsbD family protein [Woeseia sp.]|nr:CsbD family protein [Woeseia sp.]MBT8096957.1 CsbD family protein [Woeseia sp.]NNE61220.1 CsbD family protein [Woeseia sp.]